MITRRISLLFLLITAVTGGLSGQVSSNMTMSDFYRNFKNSQLTRSIGEKSEITGSPYDAAEFVPGEIITRSAQRYTGIPLRYNIYSDKIEFKNQEGEIFEVGLPEVVDTIVIGDKKFLFRSYQLGSKQHEGYLRVLTEGNPALLQKMNIFLKPAEPAQGYKDPVPAGFDRTQDDYYLAFLTGETLQFNGKKEFMEILPGFRTEIEQFLKTNRTKFNKADDLVKLINYYNSLEE